MVGASNSDAPNPATRLKNGFENGGYQNGATVMVRMKKAAVAKAVGGGAGQQALSWKNER